MAGTAQDIMGRYGRGPPKKTLPPAYDLPLGYGLGVDSLVSLSR
jgi:hypothetical protein